MIKSPKIGGSNVSSWYDSERIRRREAEGGVRHGVRGGAGNVCRSPYCRSGNRIGNGISHQIRDDSGQHGRRFDHSGGARRPGRTHRCCDHYPQGDRVHQTFRVRILASVLIMALLTVMVGSVFFCDDASATKIYPNGSGGSTVEYNNGRTVQLGAKATENVENAINALSVDTGATGQTGASVVEAPSSAIEAAKKVAEGVTKGGIAEEYGSRGYSFEEDLLTLDESAGTMPTAAAIIEGLPTIALAAGTFYAGYKIGESINGLIGISGEGEEHLTGCSCGTIKIHPYKGSFTETDFGPIEEGKTGTTFEFKFPSSGVAYYEHSLIHAWINHSWQWTTSVQFVETKYREETGVSEEFTINPDGGIVESENYYNGKSYKVHIANVILGNNGAKRYLRNGIEHGGWPSSKVSLSGVPESDIAHPVVPSTIVPPMTKPSIYTETKKNGGSLVPTSPPKVTEKIVETYVKEVRTNKESEAEEEIKGKPENPLVPELPLPSPTETGTEYKTQVETAGWTKVSLRTLTESQIDSEVGPENVAYTIPTAGSHVEFSSEVIIEQNPSNAANPAEPSEGIGPPTLPGIKVPNFAVLCKGFPFGVPCWLIKTVESWSASSTAPVWELGEFSIKGVKIPGATFHLSHLEPIMEYARPAMLIFATVGLVILFYKFATKGGGPPSGSGTEDPGEMKEVY